MSTTDHTTAATGALEPPGKLQAQIELCADLWISGFASGFVTAEITGERLSPTEAEEAARNFIEHLTGKEEGRQRILQEVGDALAGIPDRPRREVRL